MMWPHTSWRTKIIGFLTMLVVVGASIIWRWWPTGPLLSPLIEGGVARFINPPARPSSSKIVYGFLPYWNISKATLQPELTHLAYFSLTIGEDGTLVSREGSATEPGYRQLQSENFLHILQNLQQQQTQPELVISLLENEGIENFLASPMAQTELLKNLDSVLLAYPFTGLNIDIEYSGEASPAMRQQFVTFLKKVRQHLDQKYERFPISVDMYATASTRNLLWDVAAIEPEVDYIVVMAYDFHQRSSPQAGPVAPLFGGEALWDTDIAHQLQAFLEVVPPEKIILGIPFYGYQWQTTSADPLAFTFPRTGSTASFQRVQEMLAQREELGITESWSQEALTPFLSFTEDGETYVVHYENAQSLAYKLDYVNQLNLGGVAIWALGYEGSSRELWDVISDKLSTPTSE